MQISKDELGEILIARNKVARQASGNAALCEAIALLDAVIVRVLAQAAPSLAVNSVNHLYH